MMPTNIIENLRSRNVKINKRFKTFTKIKND